MTLGPATTVGGIDVLFGVFAVTFCAAWVLHGREETRTPRNTETAAPSV